MLTLIRGAELYGPESLGTADLLIVGGRIAQIGRIDEALLVKTGLPLERVDGRGMRAVPGFIDAHSHLIGTGGEQGYASRTLDVPFEDLVQTGVTTVVGCRGTDDISRTLEDLLGRVRQLTRFGITALAYTGSFHIPARSLTRGVRDDLQLIPEFVGVGEVAIADMRSTEPTVHELARLAKEAFVGGIIGEKAGVLHLHVGPGKHRAKSLIRMLDEYDVEPRIIYVTHMNRSDELLDDGVELAKRGCFVDLDCVDPKQGRWIRKYLERGGPPDRLTLTSDAHTPGTFERQLHEEFVWAVLEEGLPFETVLRLITKNPAVALKLPRKGRLAPGADGDVVLLDASTLAVRTVIANGRVLMRDGVLAERPKQSFDEP